MSHKPENRLCSSLNLCVMRSICVRLLSLPLAAALNGSRPPMRLKGCTQRSKRILKRILNTEQAVLYIGCGAFALDLCTFGLNYIYV